MKKCGIISIVALSFLGVSLVCGVVKMNTKKDNIKKNCLCMISVFVALVLLGVSQLVKETYKSAKGSPPGGQQSVEKSFEDTSESPSVAACKDSCSVSEKVLDAMCWAVPGSELGPGEVCETAFFYAEQACEVLCDELACEEDSDCGQKDLLGMVTDHCNDNGMCQHTYTAAECSTKDNECKKLYGYNSGSQFDTDSSQCTCMTKPCAAVWNSEASECVLATNFQKYCDMNPGGSYDGTPCDTSDDTYNTEKQCCKYASYTWPAATCNNWMDAFRHDAKSWVNITGAFSGCKDECETSDGVQCK
jgi:hypothetical protein